VIIRLSWAGRSSRLHDVSGVGVWSDRSSTCAPRFARRRRSMLRALQDAAQRTGVCQRSGARRSGAPARLHRPAPRPSVGGKRQRAQQRGLGLPRVEPCSAPRLGDLPLRLQSPAPISLLVSSAPAGKANYPFFRRSAQYLLIRSDTAFFCAGDIALRLRRRAGAASALASARRPRPDSSGNSARIAASSCRSCSSRAMAPSRASRRSCSLFKFATDLLLERRQAGALRVSGDPLAPFNNPWLPQSVAGRATAARYGRRHSHRRASRRRRPWPSVHRDP
jgi:hypothetical protein